MYRLHDTCRRIAVHFAALVLALSLMVPAKGAQAGSAMKQFKAHDPQSQVALDHSAWTVLLKAYVVPGEGGLNRVDYARFKDQARAKLGTYLAYLQSVEITKLNRKEQFAYWANLYNAKTIDIILEHYPVESIKDIRLTLLRPFDGPWVADVVKVEGQALSLNDIEHEILRKVLARSTCPLCGQLRVHRVSQPAEAGVFGRKARSHARGGPVRVPISTAHAASRSWRGMSGRRRFIVGLWKILAARRRAS